MFWWIVAADHAFGSDRSEAVAGPVFPSWMVWTLVVAAIAFKLFITGLMIYEMCQEWRDG